MILLNAISVIFIQIPLQFIPEDPIDNKSIFCQGNNGSRNKVFRILDFRLSSAVVHVVEYLLAFWW